VKPTPAGLESAGKKLWRSVLSVYELAPHELLLLERAARCADPLAKIDRLIAKTTPIAVGSVGQRLRQRRIGGGCLMRRPEGEHGLMEVVDWRPEIFRGFVRELIQRHGTDPATARELMPAALRTDWLSPAQFEAMLDEEEWPDGEAD
jgi:hypothetical protein